MSEKKHKDYKNASLSLWILLVVALAIAIGVSFVDNPSFFGFTFKKGTFYDLLTAGTDVGTETNLIASDSTAESQSSVAADLQMARTEIAADSSSVATRLQDTEQETTAAEPSAKTANVEPAAGSSPGGSHSVLEDQDYAGYTPRTGNNVKSVLIFGDSMTILVANRLAQYGKKNGYSVHSITWDSSSSVTWSQCDTLDNFIRRYRPDLIMITLGSNELFLKNFNSRRPDVERLLAKIGNIPFLWISPPNWKEDKGYNAFMKSILPPGTFFNSNNLVLPRQKDHIHPTREGGVTWTDSIMKWVPRSAHPIKAEVPDPGTSSKHNVHYFKARR